MIKRIEAVTVCVDYADFLRETIPFNQPLFDRWVIVTTEKDEATRTLCHRHGLECVLTEEFYRDGHPFCKGRGLARGVEMLGHDDWLVHIDADMVLPKLTRQLLNAADLDERCIYGIDRAMVVGWEQWTAIRDAYLQYNWHFVVSPPRGLTLGGRGAMLREGYVPIGAFQMWHRSAVLRDGHQIRPIPYFNGDAAHDDVRFALRWDRRHRVLLPEIIALHLESEGRAKWGANWSSRQSKPFGAEAGESTEGAHRVS